jgi:hypothetical protein
VSSHVKRRQERVVDRMTLIKRHRLDGHSKRIIIIHTFVGLEEKVQSESDFENAYVSDQWPMVADDVPMTNLITYIECDIWIREKYLNICLNIQFDKKLVFFLPYRRVSDAKNVVTFNGSI